MFPVDNMPSSRTIFINPNFNKLPTTHVNPKFLLAQKNPSIHVNPNFLLKTPIQTRTVPPVEPVPLQTKATVAPKVDVPLLPNKIISKSRTKIVRIPMNAPPVVVVPTKVTPPKPTIASGSLIKVGLRKLIRTTVSKPANVQDYVVPSAARAKYKVDRRVFTERNPIRTRKTSFTGRYALRRSSESKRTVSRFVKRNSDALSFSKLSFKKASISSKNRQLQLLNINGVLYKSTRNKLERNDVKKMTQVKSLSIPKKTTGERGIFVRGTKYLLDKTGYNLTRVTNTKPSPGEKSLRRIDIGGLTYVANSKNVLVRTDTHLTRNHVSSAKQKSINLLSRRFVKMNIPCPIYRLVGKCAAFESGKCMKVHDKKHVAICQRFLRGECINNSCLLSHNISLSKMPVCKFFLQGCCVREDCPYLHKKLSAKAEICTDFLKGFCKLAQECNKRHEFVCPDMETLGKCKKVKCPYCRKQLKTRNETHSKKAIGVEAIASDHVPVLEAEEPCVRTRYFVTDSSKLGEKIKVSEPNQRQCDDEDSDSGDNDGDATRESKVPKRRRPQLGELPAFIPFS